MPLKASTLLLRVGEESDLWDGTSQPQSLIWVSGLGVRRACFVMDRFTKEQRSRCMANIRAKDTKPELLVRRYLHRAGLRYRVHGTDLPGRPDLVFASRRACVFVNGCFWHGCPHCKNGLHRVASNDAYWRPKAEANRLRDERNQAELAASGWTVVTIWECEVRTPAKLAALEHQVRGLKPLLREDRDARFPAKSI
jgi:DNA mismatch endonuclease (patch repair protein)